MPSLNTIPIELKNTNRGKFNLKRESSKFLVWVRILHLNVLYFNEDFLRPVGDELGTYLKAVERTIAKTCPAYARILVEVDLKMSLVRELYIALYYKERDCEILPNRTKCVDYGNAAECRPSKNHGVVALRRPMVVRGLTKERRRSSRFELIDRELDLRFYSSPMPRSDLCSQMCGLFSPLDASSTEQDVNGSIS
uniref:DUF4283 domain-containing protein n=1 Tax=Kalanchoe fedtschenkoi TaxID=63787 RepID=A0A7N0ZR64_KALFE